MFKSLLSHGLRLFALTLLITQINVSYTLAQTEVPLQTTNFSSTETVTPLSESTKVTHAQENECEQSTTLDCQKITSVSQPKLTYPEPPNPYNREAIEKFDAELYGEGN